MIVVQTIGRNGKKTLAINFNYGVCLEEANTIIDRLKCTSVDRCYLIDPFVNQSCSKRIIQECSNEKIPVYIETGDAVPQESIKVLMTSCDNEVIFVYDTNKNMFPLLDSALDCFHNGIHLTLKISSELKKDITEYDLLRVISLFKNWVHLISIDTSVSGIAFDWNNIINFIKENKIDLEDRSANLIE